MRGIDIPQTDDLERVVQAVEAVQSGARSADEVGLRIGLSARHAGYALHAARVLGFIQEGDPGWTSTRRGRDLLDRQGASRDEGLRDAIGESRLMRVAPHLLESRPVTLEGLVRAIGNLTGLSQATAERRAKTLLSWRRRLVQEPGLFPKPEPPDRASYVADLAEQDLVLRRLAIENYGPLRQVAAELGRCTVIVGRNATGKSTFLDALGFLADALEHGLERAWRARSEDWHDLLWYGRGDAFTLALEVEIPEWLRPDRRVARYELCVGVLSSGAVGVRHERLYLRPGSRPPRELLHADTPRGWLRVVGQGEDRAAYFHAEVGDWKTVFQLPPEHLALANVQASLDRFPVALRVRDLLSSGVTQLALSADAMRRACSPRLTGRLRRNGENLPLRIAELQESAPDRFRRWIAQVREALPQLDVVEVGERPEDRHRYLIVKYKDGLRVPAWRLSDGTLRILALTLLGYLDEDAIVLVEEPENGVHPRAVEAVYEALAAAPRSQILVATHSPVLLGIVPPDDLLCFVHDGQETTIVPGREHPALKSWRHEVDLGTMFAAGILD